MWGQHSAWQDQVITTWLVQYMASHLREVHGIHQSVQLWDCLAAQWALPVLHEQWDNQMTPLPIMPGATAYLQGPDTHWNFPIKADMRQAKASVQHDGELLALRKGEPYQSKWGLVEITETLARTAQMFEKRNDTTQIIGRASIENHLTVYRPVEGGALQCIEYQQWFKDPSPSA